ncbi:MAG: hypothetical protein BWX61_00700 [Bacteroidetes bacterium ADurb.Bin035]|nr:MAG: hypothetical protein BWX61_00700 [Bacteroidetes bacterium ADurb.Bin035]
MPIPPCPSEAKNNVLPSGWINGVNSDLAVLILLANLVGLFHLLLSNNCEAYISILPLLAEAK